MTYCKICGKNTYTSWKTLCVDCFKKSKKDEQSKKEEELKIKQESCKHEKSTTVRYPTTSGCTMIIEQVCENCRKVLSHRSEDIEYSQQAYFKS